MSPAMVGTVPIYDAVGFYDKNLQDITVDEFFDVVQKSRGGRGGLPDHPRGAEPAHGGAGQDWAKRLTNIVSRGGSLLFTWMEINKAENPFYEHYDRLLDICEEHDVTLSLGDGCRPGCLHDATDASQVEELVTLGELTKRAWERNVQVMIEGPGHMAMNEIAGQHDDGKAAVPRRAVLRSRPAGHGRGSRIRPHHPPPSAGPSRACPARTFLCYVTPAEHLRLPTSGRHERGHHRHPHRGPCRGHRQGTPRCRGLGQLHGQGPRRPGLERPCSTWPWTPCKPVEYRESSKPEHEDSCTMCGKMCAVRNMNRVLEGKDIQLDD